MKRSSGMFWVILSAVLFGLMPLGAKFIYANGGNSLTLTFFRFFFGAPLLYLMMRFLGNNRVHITKQQFGKILLLSLGYAGTPILLFASYNYIPTGMATTVHYVYPVLVLLTCVLFFREGISIVKVLCCVLCTGGILLFYTPGVQGSTTGVVLAFLSGVSYAFYVVYLSKSGLQALPHYQLGFYLASVSAALLLVICLASGALTLALTPIGWGAALIFAFVISCVATIAFQRGTLACGPQKASILSTFEPLTSVLVGVALFREPLSLRAVCGIALILLAVLLLAAKDRA